MEKTHHRYRPTGELLESVSQAEGRAYMFDYGSRIDGQPISVSEISIDSSCSDDLTTTFSYDANHRLSKVGGPNGSIQEFVYHDCGRLWKQIDHRVRLPAVRPSGL